MDADGNQVDDGAGAQQLNLNINLAINNGGLAAEINANGDVNAFFVMIGVQGPLETMFYNVLLISVAIFLLIGVGVWIPYITGKTVVWVTRDVYAPVVQSGIQTTLKQIQHITDPIIDPVADAVVWGLRMLSPAHFLYGNLTESVKANISAISVNSSLEVVEPITTLTSAVVSQVKCSSTTEKIRKPIAPEEKFASLSVATTFTGTTSLGSQITAQTPRSSPTEAMSTTSVKRTFRLFGKNSPVSSSSIQPSATQSSSEPAPIIAIFEVNPLPTAVENVTVSNSTSVNATIVQGNAAANATDVEKGADHHFAKGWPRPSLRDRLTYAFVGYWTYTLGLLIHAHQQGYLEHPYAQTLNRTLIKWTRYSALGLKFTMMMVIELGLFPFFCGVLIDICTLPIFGPHATISNRIGFYFRHPWTSRFLHWLVGTTFMYQFILYIATVRAVVRKGVMWFIRDPNDNAMNEIMGRPTLVQLRKLAFGTLMYATIIVAGFGGYVVSIMGLQSFLATLGFDVNSGPLRVLPLKYEFSEPLAEFPIDLLAFHFLLPWTISLIRPMEVFQKLVRLWFRFAARRLSLSSFLFGVRYEDEEDNAVEYDDEVNDGATAGNSTDSKGKAPATADTSVLSDEPQDSAGNNDTPQPSSSSNAAEALSSSAPANADPATSTGDSNGTLEPPATTREAVDDGSGWEDESDPDSPAMREASLGPTWEQLSSRPAQPSGPRPRRQYRFMRVPNHDNIEVIPGQKIMIPIRERDPIVGRPNETQEDVAANWTKVYVPDRFRARVIALVILHWLAGLWLAVAVTVVPLYLGRFMFSSLYSFMLQSDTSTPATPPPSRGGVRPDLQVHDLYAWSLGTFTWVVLTRPLFPAIRAALRIRRRRRSEARAAARLAAVARTVRAGAGVEVLVPEKTYLQRLEEHVNAAGDLWYNWAFGRRTRDVHRGGAGDRRRRAAGGRRRVVVHRQPRGGEGDGARREGEGDVEVIDGEGEEVEEVNAGVRGDGQAARRAGGRPGVEWRRRRAAPELALEDQLMALAIVVAMWVYLIVIVGVVIPMLVGLIFELYVIQPFKGTREQTHILFLLQDWALGAVYVKVAHMLVLLGPENGFRRVVNDATNARRIGDVRMAELTRVLLAPVIGMCLVVILMPLIMGRALDKVLAVVVGQATRTLVLRYIFPFTLVLFLGYEVLGNARGWVQMWMNQVRDDVYLVGRRLHNHQDEEVRDGQRVDDEAFAVPPPPPAPPPPPPVAAGGGAAFAGRL
ncbi:hypothetical protein BJ742DRAFT_66466 [Cladochytrium replicatum]|nr:hypothetical protein BJ742DRAFT_66466 [Cladochytrium replicatum]